MPEVKPFRLTESVKAAGCASKLSPAALDKVLGQLPRQHDPNVLVGFDHADDEPKFGYAVTGLIHPKKVLANAGAQPGDALIFTKALGTGVISTAIKKSKAEPAWIDAAVQSMTTLNKQAGEVIQRGDFHIHAMTDVTGFGMIGHAREMVLASNVSFRLHAGRIPVLPGALECIRAGYIPGGLINNRDFAECVVDYEAGVPEDLRALLFDPQTAGGLLISVASEESAKLTQSLHAAGVAAIHIGEVVAKTKPLITVKL
jgi:selenide,water dikinase